MTVPSTIARELKALRRDAGLRLRDMADRLGMSVTGYQHYEDRFKDEVLPARMAPPLLELFAGRGIARERVLRLFEPLTLGLRRDEPQPAAEQARPQQMPAPPAPAAGNGSQFGAPHGDPSVDWPGEPPRLEVSGRTPLAASAFRRRDMPVFGSAMGGPDGRFEWNGQVIDWAERPPVLEGVRDSYAVYMVGTSMEPRYFDGELLYVHPGRRVTPQCFVCVQLWPRDEGGLEEALIKQFVRRDAERLILREFSPAERLLEIAAARVKAVHRIILGGEG